MEKLSIAGMQACMDKEGCEFFKYDIISLQTLTLILKLDEMIPTFDFRQT